MRLAMFTSFALCLAPFTSAQHSFNPLASDGNRPNSGTPLTPSSSAARGPAPGSMNPLGALPGPGALATPGGPLGSATGTRAPGSPQRQGRFRGERGWGGPVYVPVPVFGAPGGGFNPPPGQYDPIFGVYNPGGYNPGIPYQQTEGEYPAPQQTPTVIINQYFQPEVVHPVFHDYTNVPLPQPGRSAAPQTGSRTPAPPADEPPADAGGARDGDRIIYLIALKDHTIYPALAYWIEQDTLNYVTMQGSPNRVSLSLVDRDLSLQLNGERGLAFKLPAAQ